MIRFLVSKSVTLVPWKIRTLIRRLPIIAFLQRVILSATLAGREFEHRIDAGPGKGLVFPVIFPDDKNIWTGTYELPFISAIAESIRPGDVCFDIGGFRGYCSGVMAINGASQVFAFEPMPSNLERIEALRALNPSLRIVVNPVAVGAHDGEAKFSRMDSESMGKLANSPFQAGRTSRDFIRVPVRSLDSLVSCGEVATPQVIKIDVEGAEVSVLTGAEKLLRNAKPRLFIESHSRDLTLQVVSLLTCFGYTTLVVESNQPPDGLSESEVCHLYAFYA